MLRVKPFAALRPTVELASKVASVPYDVVNTSEARALASGNPHSFLHVIRPDIDLPDSVDHAADVVFETAKGAFARMQQSGTLVREGSPRMYLYRQQMELLGQVRSQTGIVCCCHIDDYANNLIKKHEKTRKDKEDERTRHVVELNANAEPVFFLYQDRDDLAQVISRGEAHAALYDFTSPDGVRHTVWTLDDDATNACVRAFAQTACAYVADGHHRTASAARAGGERRAKNPRHTGEEEYNWFLAVLFPASKLTILPYHRVVKDLNGLSPGDFLSRLAKVGAVTPTTDPNPKKPGSFCVYVGGSWHSVVLPESSIDRRDPIGSLDYVLLAERVLTPILGVGDLRTDKRIDFVGGIRGPGELKKRVDEGSAAVAFCMFPTTIGQLTSVADAGQIMPPKSTWFEPKLRSGLLIHTLE